jgi:hypothetical protein
VIGPTHYETLGVGPSASPDQVRAAYRAAARDHHPDAGGDPDRMRALNAAWHVLGDQTRRAAYDQQLALGASGRQAAPGPGPGTGAGYAAPSDEGWMPDMGDLRLSPEDWADLADGRPIGQSLALRGWWAILPPGMIVASVVLLFGAAYFRSPALYAMAGGAFILALGLFVLAPLRAMAKRKEG